jgi:hypothetical protein
MCGYVAILYSGLRQADLTDEATDDADVDWYQEYKQSAIMDKLPSLPRTDPYRLLQPKAFVSLFRLGRLAPRDAYWALPVIMRLICLRRDMEDPVDCDDNRRR